MKVYAWQGDTLDAVCLRHYGHTRGAVETVMNANPGLADTGVILPQGLPIEMPDIIAPTTQDTVQLWD